MIAIPLDNENSTQISKLYGKAPYFAILDIDSGSFKVIENGVKGSGPKSASFLKKFGVDSTIFYHMGDGVYKSFKKENMDVYCAKYNLYSIDEIYRDFLSDSLQKLDESNYKELLDSGESSCSCGCSSAK
jgi:predicted Fe-Mo cluster-binding NifX family protein